MTNGAVYTAAAGPDGTVYIGGEFTSVGPMTGGIAALDATTGLADAAFPSVDGQVLAAVSDGAGGHYIAGYFVAVDGVARDNIAHVLSDGSVDPSFDPGADNMIRTLALSGTTLYVGGDFSTIADAARSRIAALDTTTGSATSWNPGTTGGGVWSIVVSGSTVYAGGWFSAIGGQSRNNIAALDTTTGNATSWNPNANYFVFTLSLTGSTVYAGGRFTVIGGQSRSRIAALDASGNATAFNPSADGDVFAVVPSGETIYAAGDFGTIGGAARGRIAALNTSGGATAWDPGADGQVNALAVSGSTVYVGGYFATAGGAARNHIAALDVSSGAATSWDPNANGTVSAVSVSGSTVYVCGGFTMIGGADRANIAAIDPTTGTATPWDPGANDFVFALQVEGPTVYAGGQFTAIGGATRNCLAALDTTVNTGNATAWNPDVDGTVRAIAVAGSTVYAGGQFATVNGATTRTNVAAFDAGSGIATSWDPAANDMVRALAVSGSTVYAGGSFDIIGGQDRSGIAALDASGNATLWDPRALDDSRLPGSVYALNVSGSTIYVGGRFTVIGGQSRIGIAALDADLTTNNAMAWDPHAAGPWGSPGTVSALAVSGSTVYAGGYFESIGGQSRASLAGLDVSSGSATSWDPGGGSTISALAFSGPTLFVGGWFTYIGEQNRSYLAAFWAIPSGTMSINGGADYTTSTSITIDSAIADAAEMRFRDAAGLWSDWQGFSTTKSWTLPGGQGLKTIESQYRSSRGLLLSVSDSIVFDDVPPSGSFTINDDTGFVNSRAVTLHPTADDSNGPVELQVRNGGGSWPVGWQTIAADVPWMLTSPEGDKTVEVRFRDAAGNISETVIEAVTIELTPPIGWIIVANGALAINTHEVTVETWASDLNGGVVVRARNGGEAWPASWTPAGSDIPITLPTGEGTKVVQAQFKDLAGNTIVTQDDVLIDTIDPVGSMSIVGDDEFTTTTAVTLALAATDTNKVDAFRLRQNEGVWSGWQDMVEMQPVTLTGADGAKTVEVQYRDIAGNTSAVIPDTIFLDRAAPTTGDDFDGLWHDSAVTLTLSAADDAGGSGMSGGLAKTEYSLDGGATWVTGESVTYRIWKRGGGSGVHTLLYRSTDAAGNLEETRSREVLIDARPPVTTDDAPTSSQAGPVTVHLAAADSLFGVTACSGLRETRYSLDGGAWAQGTEVTVSGVGTHWVAYYSVDNVGNVEYAKWCSVTITGAASSSMRTLRGHSRRSRVGRPRPDTGRKGACPLPGSVLGRGQASAALAGAPGVFCAAAGPPAQSLP